MRVINLCCLAALVLALGIAQPETAIAQTATHSEAAKSDKKAAPKTRHHRNKRLSRAERARRLAAAREKLLNEAQALMNAGKASEAYALLKPVEFELAGEKRYDYLLGISALDSGKPDKATLAFERVLAVDPNFAGARLDMARAYYQLGDMARAKTEFQTVMQENPPPLAKATIQKYLNAIAAREAAKKTRLSGYVEMTVGYDTNVNSATSQAVIPVPVFNYLPFTLSQANIKKRDSYAGVAFGGAVRHLVGEHTGVYARIDVHQRGNNTQHQFDTIDIVGHAGAYYMAGSETFRAGLLMDQYTLGSARNRDTTGINGEWRHVFSPSNQVSLFGQYSRNRFVDPALQVQDFDQSIVGAGWLHVLPDGRSALFGSLFTGYENDTAPVTATNPSGGRPDGDKNMAGLRVGAQMMLTAKVDGYASVGTQNGRYDRQNAAFLTVRNDRQEDATVGISWHFAKLWSLQPQMAWSRNNSNIPIYTYNRTDVSVTVRRDFR